MKKTPIAARVRLKRLAPLLLSIAIAMAALSTIGASAQDGPNGGSTVFFELGSAAGLALDSSDLPVVVVTELFVGYPDPPAERFLIRCANLTCSEQRSSTPLPSLLYGEFGLDIDDRPMWVDDESIISCGDPACTTIDDPVTVFAESDTTVLVDYRDDGSVLVVRHGSETDEHPAGTTTYYRCDTRTCAERDMGTFEGQASDFTLDPNGLPAYILNSELVRCTDIGCSQKRVNPIPGTGGKITFGESGFPIIVVDEITPAPELNEIWGWERYQYRHLVMHCDDDLCIDERDNALPQLVEDLEFSHRENAARVVSLSLGPGGLPLWELGQLTRDYGYKENYSSIPECRLPGCTAPETQTRLRLQGRGHIAFTTSGIPLQLWAEPDVSGFGLPENPTLQVCGPGTECYGDDDGDGVPIWLEEELPPTPTPTAVPPFDLASEPPSRLIAVPGQPAELLAVGPNARPVWTQPNGDLVNRCSTATCESIEQSPTTGLLLDEVLVDSTGTTVLVGRPDLSGVPDPDPVEFVVRRCQSGAAGFCDPVASQSHEVRRSTLGQDFSVDAAVLDAQDRLVLASEGSDNAVLRCANPLCTALLVTPVPIYHSNIRGMHLMLPNDRPLVLAEMVDRFSIRTFRCRNVMCDDTYTDINISGSYGFLPWEDRNVEIVDVADASGAKTVLLMRSEGLPDQIFDCVYFGACGPLSASWPIEQHRLSQIEKNDLGHLVAYGEGFVTVCATNYCDEGRTTEPVMGWAPGDTATMTLTEDSRPIIGSGEAILICASRACKPAETHPLPRITAACRTNEAGDRWSGSLDVGFANVSTQPVSYEIRTGQVERPVEVPPRQVTYAVSEVTGRNDGPLVSVVSQNGVDVASGVDIVACDGPPPTKAITSCVNGQGRIDVAVSAPQNMLPRTFDVQVSNQTRQVTLTDEDRNTAITRPGDPSEHASEIATVSSRADGTYQVVVIDTQSGTSYHNQTVTVACDLTPAHSVVVSCLAGNGRLDFTIVEQTTTAANWAIKVPGLSLRARTVTPGDWWRMPFTGRPDGDYPVEIFRDGTVVATPTATIACDQNPPQVATKEVTVTSACRSGRGYILFQFTNATPNPKSWVLEFEGVPNRSTSAPAWATSVKAVTGRPDGTYEWKVRGQAPRTVTVDCS